MEISVAAVTHLGFVRRRNEDAIAAIDDVLFGAKTGPILSKKLLKDGPIVCAVADGMGGHGRGDEASEYVVRTLIGMTNDLRTEADIQNAVNRIHVELCKKNIGLSGRNAMGATVCGLVLNERFGIWFNVGDSRIYNVTGSKLEQLSIDDVPLGERDSRTSSRITQCLGGTSRAVSIDVHTGTIDIEHTKNVLLASDGLTAFVDEKEILEILKDCSPLRCANNLLQLALDAGGEDNIAVAVLEVA